MKVVIFESCHFTRVGIVNHISNSNLGLKDFHIYHALNTENLFSFIQKKIPDLAFISDELILEDFFFRVRLKNIIMKNQYSIFIILTNLSSFHFRVLLKIRNNIVIASKAIDLISLRDLIERKAKKYSATDECHSVNKEGLPLTLSFTESAMLEMWMSGMDTGKIAKTLGIKEKTVSSHKFNVKIKMKTSNQLAIFHILRLVDTISSGFFVSIK